MACDTQPVRGQTLTQRKQQVRGVVDLVARGLANGTIKPVVGPQGAVTFQGLTDTNRASVSDACIYRLTMAGNSAMAKMALQRAEALAGRSVNRQAVAQGHHSHDGGEDMAPRTLTVAPRPCGSCPYRQDVPSGIWAQDEYDKLPAYDGPTWKQDTARFDCHQRDGNLCAGWLGCHGPDKLLAVRLEAIKGRLDPAVLDYTTDVPLFGSGAEARAHGMRDIPNPGPAARRMVAGLMKLISTNKGRCPEEMMTKPDDTNGPAYPDLGATVAKFRRIKNPTPEQERAYGEAVLKAIRARQRSELVRVLPTTRPNCASGTAETTGEGILAAVRRQHAAQLHADAARARKARSDDELRALYAAAMEEKRKAAAAPPAPTMTPRQLAAKKAWVTIRAKRAARLEAAE